MQNLARFEDKPWHLGTVCAPTPPGGVTAEVVDVGRDLAEVGIMSLRER